MSELHPEDNEKERAEDMREESEPARDDQSAGKQNPEAEPETEPVENETADDIELMTDEQMRKMLEKAAERDKLWDKLLRTAAEYENRHKRLERSAESRVRYAVQELLGDLLPVVDDLGRAIKAIEEAAPEIQAIMDGIIQVYSRLLEVLAKYNVKPIKSIGEKFDPNLHEAVSVIQTDEHPPSTIVDEIQPGWMLDDRVVRAPKVIVSAAPENAGDQE